MKKGSFAFWTIKVGKSNLVVLFVQKYHPNIRHFRWNFEKVFSINLVPTIMNTTKNLPNRWSPSHLQYGNWLNVDNNRWQYLSLSKHLSPYSMKSEQAKYFVAHVTLWINYLKTRPGSASPPSGPLRDGGSVTRIGNGFGMFCGYFDWTLKGVHTLEISNRSAIPLKRIGIPEGYFCRLGNWHFL